MADWLLLGGAALLASTLAAVALADYVEARRRLQATLAPLDYRYFGFQLWQEGIARYTEYQVAHLAATAYRPGADFTALHDFTPYARVADTIHRRIRRELVAADLAGARRTAFYAFGAAEGLLLDRVSPEWRRSYFIEKFDLAPHYRTAR